MNARGRAGDVTVAERRARRPTAAAVAALFDWDGTLVDSRAALLAAWRE